MSEPERETPESVEAEAETTEVSEAQETATEDAATEETEDAVTEETEDAVTEEPAAEDAAAEEPTAEDAAAEEPAAEEPESAAEGEYTMLAKVYNARNVSEARLVQSILESFHIPCAVEDEISPDIATLDGAHLGGVDVHVPAALAEEAKLVLCERGVICPVDDDVLGGFLDRLETATGDAEARGQLVRDLSQEHGKELRRTVLAKLPAYPTGLEAALGMLKDATAIEEDTEGKIATDLARLANRGAFGGAASVRFVGELSRSAAADSARTRRLSAEALGRLKNAGASTALLTLLADDDEAVRDEAIESLYVLSAGESFGYDATAVVSEREKSIVKWRAWQNDHPWA